MVLGAGWPYGGPSVSVADSAKWVRRATVLVTAASPMPLPEIDKDGKILAAFYVDANGSTRLTLEPGASAVAPPAASGDGQFFYSRPTCIQGMPALLSADARLLVRHNTVAVRWRLVAD